MKKLKEFFEKQDRFAKLLGFHIEEIEEGTATVSATIKEEHLNGADVVHGGFLFSLADFAFAIASNSKNNLSLGINANINFQKAKSGGKLFAKARELSDGKKIATYEVRISDEEDNTIATFIGTVYRKGINIV
ncbi:MAG: PaaI family thioesterase [Sulfurimonas sp.]|uniref:PaaI family thioesterase n=1 Tax=Sulfurimonas sp. TaxID=2022749 RepID=UPI0025F171D9|nr:PaaI family thioesterase [Sulfurimonas sp.]MCK9491265.1 PaaI family thioesterase [Sulfurimonas sp.]